jgi:hypothetical protein
MTMTDVLEIELPKSVSEDDLRALEQELTELDEVGAAGSTTTRAIDPVSIGLWISLASDALGLASAVGKIVQLIRGRGIEGAKLKLPDGTEISVDRASAADIERLLAAARGQ